MNAATLSPASHRLAVLLRCCWSSGCLHSPGSRRYKKRALAGAGAQGAEVKIAHVFEIRSGLIDLDQVQHDFDDKKLDEAVTKGFVM